MTRLRVAAVGALVAALAVALAARPSGDVTLLCAVAVVAALAAMLPRLAPMASLAPVAAVLAYTVAALERPAGLPPTPVLAGTVLLTAHLLLADAADAGSVRVLRTLVAPVAAGLAAAVGVVVVTGLPALPWRWLLVAGVLCAAAAYRLGTAALRRPVGGARR